MTEGDSCESSPDHCEAFGKLREVREERSRRVSHPSFRDLTMQEMEERSEQASPPCVALHEWKKEDEVRPPRSAREEAINVLGELCNSHVCAKRSRPKCDQCETRLCNHHGKKVSSHPAAVHDAQTVVEDPEHMRTQPAGSSARGQTNPQQDF